MVRRPASGRGFVPARWLIHFVCPSPYAIRGNGAPMLTRWISEERRGFALATAVGAIALVGALVAGAFVASTTEFRTGRDALQQTRAFAAAEYGNHAIRQNWNNAWNNTLLRGDTLARTYDAGG